MPYDIDFRKTRNAADVAGYIGLSEARFAEAVAASKTPQQNPSIYERHLIPKRSPSPDRYREVWDVKARDVRDAHRQLARRFRDFLHQYVSGFPHDCAYGYVKGKGIRDNAKKHCGQKILLRLDLQNFFPTITAEMLRDAFVQISLCAEASSALSNFVTIEQKLALGLNASPLLANLVCLPMDRELQRISSELNCVYTRYADDISISSQVCLPRLDDVQQAVARFGFVISQSKTRITKRGQAHFVTGLSISDPVRPHVPRAFKRRLRQEIHYCEKFGIVDHLRHIRAESTQKQINRLDGSLRFLWAIEPEIAAPLKRKWANALQGQSSVVSYAPYHRYAGVDAHILVDETDLTIDGRRHLAVACATTEHIVAHRGLATAVLQDALVDPFSAGDKEGLAARGLHFTDASEDLRTTYTKLLSIMQFRVYIAYGQLNANEEYEDKYLQLFAELLPRRFKGYDQANLTIVLEQNDKISGHRVKEIISSKYAKLVDANDRRPRQLPVSMVVSKRDEPALSLPDTSLAIFRRYFGTDNGALTELYRKRFERLRDRFRHIVNIDSGQLYSRRHPFEKP